MNWLYIVITVCALGKSVLGIDGMAISGPSSQDEGLCGFIAATNIQSIYSQWKCNSSGYTVSNPCSWPGLTCPDNNFIEQIYLFSIQYPHALSGTLPTTLGLLTTLTGINIALSLLHGSIPSSVGQLVELKSLRFLSNSLIGAIPSELGQLQNLSRLDLSSNFLAGSIPTTVGLLSSLTSFDLSYNCLIGTIPTVISNLNKLLVLYWTHSI